MRKTAHIQGAGRKKAVSRLLFGSIALVYLVIIILFTSCKKVGNPDSDPFIAVTGITGVPTEMTMGFLLELSGTVEPTSATVKGPIVWTVDPDGTTAAGADIAAGSNELYAAGEGQAIVTATIAGAGVNYVNYSQKFSITVNSDYVPPTAGDIIIGIIVINGQGIEVEGWENVFDKSLGTVNITIENFDTANWFLNGAHKHQGKTFELNLSDLKESLNFLTVVIEVGGLEYSKKLDFTVTNEEE